MKFLSIIFLITLPLLATAEEKPLDCRTEVSIRDFVADRDLGCFVESFQEGVFTSLFAPLSAGDKALTNGPGMGQKTPTVAEDFQKNISMAFFGEAAEDRGMHWPYAEPLRRVRNGSVTFDAPFNATVHVARIARGQKRVTITRNSKVVTFLCREDQTRQCDHPAIVNTNQAKEVPSSPGVPSSDAREVSPQ